MPWRSLPSSTKQFLREQPPPYGQHVASGDEIGARYCENCHVGQVVEDDVLIEDVAGEGVRKYALDPQSADALWRKSEELVDESFN